MILKAKFAHDLGAWVRRFCLLPAPTRPPQADRGAGALGILVERLAAGFWGPRDWPCTSSDGGKPSAGSQGRERGRWAEGPARPSPRSCPVSRGSSSVTSFRRDGSGTQASRHALISPFPLDPARTRASATLHVPVGASRPEHTQAPGRTLVSKHLRAHRCARRAMSRRGNPSHLHTDGFRFLPGFTSRSKPLSRALEGN